MSHRVTLLVTVNQAEGWHARPASEFATMAATSGHEVTVGRLGQPSVRGDSVLTLMMLGVKAGETLEIAIDGSSPEQVAESLKSLF